MVRVKAVIAVAFALMAQPVGAAELLKVSVKVSCEKPTSLQLFVRNNSSNRVEFAELLLPWNYSKVLRLEAFQINDGESKRLTGVAPVADYLGNVSLAPQQSVAGELFLNRTFAGFDDANESGDILLFYRINETKLSDSVHFTGSSGVILIPEKGFFTHGCPALVTPSEEKGSGEKRS